MASKSYLSDERDCLYLVGYIGYDTYIITFAIYLSSVRDCLQGGIWGYLRSNSGPCRPPHTNRTTYLYDKTTAIPKHCC